MQTLLALQDQYREWRDGLPESLAGSATAEMAVRWVAVMFRETEKHYRRITGYEHLWMLKAHLDEERMAPCRDAKGGVTCSCRRRLATTGGTPSYPHAFEESL